MSSIVSILVLKDRMFVIDKRECSFLRYPSLTTFQILVLCKLQRFQFENREGGHNFDFCKTFARLTWLVGERVYEGFKAVFGTSSLWLPWGYRVILTALNVLSKSSLFHDLP